MDDKPLIFRIWNSIKFYSKTTAILASFIGSAAYGTVAPLILSLFRKRLLTQYTVARLFYTLVKSITGVRIEIEDETKMLNNANPAIILSNHQSELDVFVIGRVFPKYTTVTAKHVLKYVPILGWFMSLSGSIFLNRSNTAQSISTLNKAKETIQTTKQNVFMFPEGTRSYSPIPTLLPLKKGAFYLAVEAQVPIIPLAVSNTSNIWNFKNRTLNSGIIKIKVLDPIPTVGLTNEDVPELTKRVEATLKSAIENMGYSKLDNFINEDLVEENLESLPLIGSTDNI